MLFTNCNDYNLSTGSAFFRVHTDIDKDGDCLQSNNNDFLNDLWLWCVSVNILHVSCLLFTNCNDYNLSTGSAFFRVHTDIDKDGDCLQSNNNDFLNDLWLLFATLLFFLESLV